MDLGTLNDAQRHAVTAPVAGRLQIIAGPGTGKTTVITARVAYLLEQGVPPNRIIVTTFTKKAANEMTERLRKLGGAYDVDKLIVGTFHSICFRIIKRYGHRIGVEGYSIADEKDSMHVLRQATEDMGDVDDKKVRRAVSSLKARGILSDTYNEDPARDEVVAVAYAKYQARLAHQRLLDFDDCLVTCHRIVSQHAVLSFVEHVLVDEFQDTSEIQLRLMYEFAAAKHNVTIVGDPDQSIYAFRDAQLGNFAAMHTHYQRLGLKVQVVTLEENYRSTSAILELSESIMRQQALRHGKNLRSQATELFAPVHYVAESPEHEARWICYQMEHLAALPGAFDYSDMAVLVRTAYQTRAVEAELVRRKIPYFMVKGKAFWDRKEVGHILDVLRIVGRDDRLAGLRAVGLKPGVGPKTIELIEKTIDAGHPVLEAMRKAPLAPKVAETVGKFVLFVERARDLDTTREALFDHVYEHLGLKAGLENDADRHLNVMEVRRQFLEFEPVEETLPQHEAADAVLPVNIVHQFVESVGLYDHGKEDDSAKGKVAVSTIHLAKGLEWPVVFVPGVCEGLLPASFAGDLMEALNEERRCFYVATTRAKLLLMLLSGFDEGGWRTINKVSRFIEKVKLNKDMDVFTKKGLAALYKLLNKQLPATFKQEAFESYYVKRMDDFVRGTNYEISADMSDQLATAFVSARKLHPRPKFVAPRKAPAAGIDAFFQGAENGSKTLAKAPPQHFATGRTAPGKEAKTALQPKLASQPTPVAEGSKRRKANGAFVPPRRAPPYIPDRTRPPQAAGRTRAPAYIPHRPR